MRANTKTADSSSPDGAARQAASSDDSSLGYLERYRDIAPDYGALRAATLRPQAKVVWANLLTPATFDRGERLQQRAPEATPLTWTPDAWRVAPEASPGTWPEYHAGLFHTQEEAAIWPGDLLGARPGERILDLCAAPGNKTLRIAAQMQNRGVIVANERSWGRLASMRFNLARMGITCVITRCGDGRQLPAEVGLFDRTLADVPCSCEGTGRKRRGAVRACTPRERASMSDLQTGLLRRAIAHTRVGGVIVYATCTYAPEENEGVLNRIDPSLAAIEPVQPPRGLVTSPGISEWMGTQFRADVQHAHRLWADQNDTGGFFVARLRRLR